MKLNIIILPFILLLLICFIIGNSTNVKVKADKKNKLSDDEIVNYVSNYMKKEYNKDFKIELITKDTVIYSEGFSVFGIPTGVRSYKVNGCYHYEFKISDKDNVVATAQYTDPYYVNQTYYNKTFEEDYGKIILQKEKSKKLQEIAYQYLKDEELIKYEYIDKSLDTVTGKSVIYLNYSTGDITKELIGKLLAISLDYDMNNAYVVFLDDLDTFYSIEPNDIGKIYKLAFNVNEIDGEPNVLRQDLYDNLYTSLKNKTTLSDNNIKSIENNFFKCIQDFIIAYDKFYGLKVKYDSQTLDGFFEIYTDTLNNNQIKISTKFYYNSELEKYEFEHITVWDTGSIVRWSLALFSHT